MKTVSAFTYWSDGSTRNQVIPPLEEGPQLPWIVHAREGCFIAINVLVYAATADGAINRVRMAIEESAAKQYPSEGRHAETLISSFNNKVFCLRKAIDKATATPLDTQKITKIAWADNDVIL